MWARMLRLLERPSKAASLLYFEKCLILFDLMQIQALLFGLSQPWPWPYFWLRASRWTTYFNIDVLLLSKYGAPMGATGGTRSLWGEMTGFIPRYSLPLGLIPLVFFGLYYITKISLPYLARNGYTTRSIAFWYRLRALLLLIGQYFVVPCGLAVLRLLHCRDDTRRLDADPIVKCGSFDQYGMLLLLLPVYVVFLVSLFLGLYSTVTDVTIYSSAIDHEMFLQRLELEWELKVSDTWLSAQLWLVSSYKRHSSHYRSFVAVQKLLLVILYTLLRSNLSVQAVLFWLVITLGAARVIYAPPFRCVSSNAILLVAQMVLVFNATLGTMTCMKIRESFLVSTNQTVWLFSGNGLAAFLIVVVLGITHREVWPSHPTSLKLREHGEVLHEWIAALRDARELVVDCNMKLGSHRALIVPIHMIEAQIKRVRNCWADAKARHSLLESSLRETLEDLVYIHERFDPIAFPPETLTDPAFDMSDRQSLQILMNPLKRRLLIKLLGIRWLNDSMNRQVPV